MTNMKKSIKIMVLFGALFSIVPSSLFAQNMTAKTYQGEHKITVEYSYIVHIPTNTKFAESGKFPVLFFLHGAGERGTDTELLKVHGPPKLAANDAGFPFIVIAPQCPKNERWDAQALNFMLDDLIKQYPIDESRIYLTGLSMGGYGTWDLAILNPDRFAAIVPICGGSDLNAYMAHKLKNVPVWAFHGAMDEIISVQNSIKIVKALRAAGNDAKFTIYPDAGHDSWTATYENPLLFEWLLAQRLE